MEKLTMLDYVKETPGVLRTNIEQYAALVEPLMKEVQKKEIKRIRWTNGKDLVKYSLTTVSFMVALGAYFYVIDLLVSLLRSVKA